MADRTRRPTWKPEGWEHNPQWLKVRDWLLDAGYKRLWEMSPKETGMTFALAAYTSAQGVVVLQIWQDQGLEVYTDTAPRHMDALKKWLTVEDPR